MNGFANPLSAIGAFLDSGGSVLWAILLLALVLWSLIVERLLFFRLVYPALARNWVEQWQARKDKRSKLAQNIRIAVISRAQLEMRKTVSVIKVLIALCPLLGLLGTVTGMIHVFDVMAVMGTGNARAMAAGVSRATMPTMAGMVIAIASLYFIRQIEELINKETHRLADHLRFD
ncbi:MAG: MotA/TolQ/ExbB proton channel family protein [Pseudomonadota bacterium]